MGSFGATVKRMCPLERGPRQAAVTLPSATRGSVGPSGARRYRVAPAPSLKGQALPPLPGARLAQGAQGKPFPFKVCRECVTVWGFLGTVGLCTPLKRKKAGTLPV